MADEVNLDAKYNNFFCSFGYASGIITTTLGQPSFLAYFDLDTRSNATSLISAIVVGKLCHDDSPQRHIGNASPNTYYRQDSNAVAS
jgi:hypothetical protein